MSTKVLNLAWDVDLPLSRKMVLIALADQASDKGECYPGIESLRRRCSMGLRTVYEAIAQLEADGYVTRRQTPGGMTMYAVNLHKLANGDLLTGMPGARVRQPQGCASRTGAPTAGVRQPQGCEIPHQGGAVAAVHKSNQEQSNPEGSARTRSEELLELGPYDRSVIDPYLSTLPEGIEVGVFVDFVKHRRVKGGVLSISSWKQVLGDLKRLAADGVDLNASLRETMRMGWSAPTDPRKSRRRSGSDPPRPRANDPLPADGYQGTNDDDLPPELRDS